MSAQTRGSSDPGTNTAESNTPGTRQGRHKGEDLEHAVALRFMWYNVGCVHKTPKTAPTLAAGVVDHG